MSNRNKDMLDLGNLYKGISINLEFTHTLYDTFYDKDGNEYTIETIIKIDELREEI